MADLGFIESETKSLPQQMQATFFRIWRALVPDLRFGHPTGDSRDPCTNFGGAFLHGTTPSVAGTEFSLPHAFGRVPYLAMPVLRLDAVGSSAVPLTVSRAADAKRVYFTSTIASAPVSVYVEG
jgi:hypothetical protein